MTYVSDGRKQLASHVCLGRLQLKERDDYIFVSQDLENNRSITDLEQWVFLCLAAG